MSIKPAATMAATVAFPRNFKPIPIPAPADDGMVVFPKSVSISTVSNLFAAAARPLRPTYLPALSVASSSQLFKAFGLQI